MVLRRIETAVARLEALAQQPGKGLPALTLDLAPQVAELQATNARLREAVVSSMQRIDALISTHRAESLR